MDSDTNSCTVLTIDSDNSHVQCTIVHLNKLFVKMIINVISGDFEVVFIDERGVSSTSENTHKYYFDLCQQSIQFYKSYLVFFCELFC